MIELAALRIRGTLGHLTVWGWFILTALI